MRNKRLASLILVLMGVMGAALFTGCSSDSAGNVYDWRGSYMCNISELTHSQQQVIQLMNGTLQFGDDHSSSQSAKAANTCRFWANAEGGALAMVGTFTQAGDEVTCSLAPDTAAATASRAAESVTIVLQGNGQTGSGDITLVDDGVSYAGTIEVERYPDQD